MKPGTLLAVRHGLVAWISPSRGAVAVALAAAVAHALPGARVAAQHRAGGTPATPLQPRAVSLPAGRVEAPLELIDGSRAVVRTMVNGQGPFLFAIETGGMMVIVTESVATAAGLTAVQLPEEVSRHGPQLGSPAARMADSIRIGDAVFQDQVVVVMPGLVPGVDGLLGLPAYAGLVMTVDYPGRRVVFERGSLPEPDGQEVVPAFSSGPFMAISVQVGGRRLPGVIDTQSGFGISVSPAVADSLPFESPPVTVGAARGHFGVVPVTAARLDGDVRIGRFTIVRPIVRAFPTPAGLPQGVLLGSEVLREFSVSLDQMTKRVRFQRRELEIPPDPPLRSLGLALAPTSDGGVIIASVADAGAAANAGVRVGDLVVAIARRPAREFLLACALRGLAQRGEAVQFEIARDGHRISVDVTPVVLVP